MGLVITKRDKIVLLFFLFPSLCAVFYSNRSYLIQPIIQVYYHYINPVAGARDIETKYKIQFEKAEEARVLANRTSTQMTANAKDTKSLGEYQKVIKDLFEQRDSAYMAMLNLDIESLQLKLSQKYKEFFTKRQEADQLDYNAFTIYRKGYENSMEITLAITNYFEKRYETSSLFKDIYKTDKSGYNMVNVKKLNGIAIYLDKYVSNDIASHSARLKLPDELVNSLLADNETLQLSNKVIYSYANGNITDGKNAGDLLIQRSKIKYTDPLDIFSNWAPGNMNEVAQLQGEAHNAAYFLYSEAYTYAKENKLDLQIEKIWGDKIPGTGEIEPSLVDYAVNDPTLPEELRENLRGYISTYYEPSVKQIRNCLNTVLSLSNQTSNNESNTWNDIMSESAFNSLKLYDQAYFTSKFVVLYVTNNGLAKNNKQIDIVFVDNPDTYFRFLISDENNKQKVLSVSQEKFTAVQSNFLQQMKWLIFQDKKYQM